MTDISARSLFFTLELNEIDDAVLTAKMKSPAAARYAPWVRDQRAFRPHQLPQQIERLLHDKSVAGRAAWMRLFDETVSALRFPVDGRDLTSAEALHLLSSPDGGLRKRAAKAVGKVFGDNIRIFALITNTLIKDKEIEDKWRGFARPVSARNLANYVEDEVVDAGWRTFRTSRARPRSSSGRFRTRTGASGRCPVVAATIRSGHAMEESCSTSVPPE